MKLKSKKVIISGGCGGIGSYLYYSLLKKKCKIGILDIDSSAIKKLKKIDKVNYFNKCDLSNLKSVSNAINEFTRKYGPVDVLINNAGVLYNEPMVSFTNQGIKKHKFSSWKKIIDANLSSVSL